LDTKSTLVGKDLSNVYQHFKKSPTDLPAEIVTKFKKKEALESMAKSVLKHRIKALTGKSTQEIEEEIGHTSPDDSGFSHQELRKMAHLLIRAAADKLPPIQASPPKAGRKRPSERSDDEDQDVDAARPRSKKVKDVNGDATPAASQTNGKATGAAAIRKTRKSLGPEMLRQTRQIATTEELVDCRLQQQQQQKNIKKTAVESSTAANEQQSDLDDLNLGPNPTPHMIARKRRSLAVTSSATTITTPKGGRKAAAAAAVQPAAAAETVPAVVKVASNKATRSKVVKEVPIDQPNQEELNDLQEEEEEEQEEVKPFKKAKRSPVKRSEPSKAAESTSASAAAPVAEKRPRKSMAQTVIESIVKPLMPVQAPEPRREFKMGFSGESGCTIFLGQSELTTFKLDTFKSKVRDFNGANLVVLATPVTWDPPDVFSMVMAVKQMNRNAGLSTFTILVGCGLTNVHLFREALYRQTKHVQFLVFDRADADLDHHKGKLRNVNHYFLLAYFFEGCETESPAEIPPMVRPGATTCFRTKNVEDLENQIVHTFTEKGDWVLDLFCGDRELSLAAQKSGRNAIAVHNRHEPLVALKVKASAIASHYDQDFLPEEDGIILQF